LASIRELGKIDSAIFYVQYSYELAKNSDDYLLGKIEYSLGTLITKRRVAKSDRIL
jgi:hypothetical protein